MTLIGQDCTRLIYGFFHVKAAALMQWSLELLPAEHAESGWSQSGNKPADFVGSGFVSE